MMEPEPFVIQVADLGWETWKPPELISERGAVQWKTLISRGCTPSDSLTLGYAEVPPGERLNIHRHAQAEVYFILDGAGVVHLDGKECAVSSRTAIFIPGNSAHGIANTGALPLHFVYAFATDSFDDVHYDFDLDGEA